MLVTVQRGFIYTCTLYARTHTAHDVCFPPSVLNYTCLYVCSSMPYMYMHEHVLLSTEVGKHASWVRAYSVHVYIKPH